MSPVAVHAGTTTTIAGPGVEVVVETEPFRLSFTGEGGLERVSEVGSSGSPLSASVFAPQPEGPLGGTRGFAPLAYLVGASPLVQWPASEWSGNDLVGATSGTFFHPTHVVGIGTDGNETVLTLTTDQPGAGPASVRISFPVEGRVRIVFTPPTQPGVVAVGDAFSSPPDERFFGFGERKDRVDQRGQVLNGFIEEENFDPAPTQPIANVVPGGGADYSFPNGRQAAYYVSSSFLSSRGYGVLLGTSAPTQYDMASSRGDAYRFQALTDHLDYSIQFGHSLPDVVSRLTATTGRAPVPPPWVFEPWIDDIALLADGNPSPMDSSFKGDARGRLLDVIAHIRAADLPVKVLGIEGWESIPDMSAVVAQAHAQGFRMSAYMNPFVGVTTPLFQEASREGVLVRDATGRPYIFGTVYQADLAALPDFTNPATLPWWRHQLERMLTEGFDGHMLDFGEEVFTGMRFANGETGWMMHNAYPAWYGPATRRAEEQWAAEHHVAAPFFYMRAGYNGSVTATGAVFPGDETTDWGKGTGLPSEIPAMVNLAVIGAGNFTPDLAGYADLPDDPAGAELYTRWSELGALSPIMRVHDDPAHGERYPWSYDSTTLATWRTYALLHHHLAQYLLDASRTAAATGIGTARPLYLADPSADDTALDTEYLLGPDLLVAPVEAPGATSRDVYLPRGSSWQPLQVAPDGYLAAAGSPVSGGTSPIVSAPLDQIPLFLRVGAANPAARGATGAVGSSSQPAQQRVTGLPSTALSRTAGAAALPAVVAVAIVARCRRRERIRCTQLRQMPPV